MGEISDEVHQVFPSSLRESADQFIVDCIDSEPLVIRKPDKEHLADSVRLALDYRKTFHYTTIPGTSDIIAKVTLDFPPTFPKHAIEGAPKPDPLETTEYWKAQIPISEDGFKLDWVLWVTKIPTTPYYRFQFVKLAALYYLAENHPHAKQILRIAAQAINSMKEVKVAVKGSFVVDLRNAK